jgi:hypothetical protein
MAAMIFAIARPRVLWKCSHQVACGFFFYMAAEVVNLVWNGHTGGVRQGDFSDSHLEVGLNDGVYVFLCDTAFPWGGKRH